MTRTRDLMVTCGDPPEVDLGVPVVRQNLFLVNVAPQNREARQDLT